MGSGGDPSTNEILGHDAVAPHAPRQIERKARRRLPALVHRGEHFVGRRLGAREHHLQPGPRHRPPRRIRVVHERVDAAERPPSDPERRDALGELGDARLGDEEVHVVHLHRVDAVFGREVTHDALHSRRRLREPAAVGHRDDRAETARERTAERRVVRDGALAQIGRMDVLAHRTRA